MSTEPNTNEIEQKMSAIQSEKEKLREMMNKLILEEMNVNEEKERIERERIEKEKAERERLERERIENERKERERLEKERIQSMKEKQEYELSLIKNINDKRYYPMNKKYSLEFLEKLNKLFMENIIDYVMDYDNPDTIEYLKSLALYYRSKREFDSMHDCYYKIITNLKDESEKYFGINYEELTLVINRINENKDDKKSKELFDVISKKYYFNNVFVEDKKFENMDEIFKYYEKKDYNMEEIYQNLINKIKFVVNKDSLLEAFRKYKIIGFDFGKKGKYKTSYSSDVFAIPGDPCMFSETRYTIGEYIYAIYVDIGGNLYTYCTGTRINPTRDNLNPKDTDFGQIYFLPFKKRENNSVWIENKKIFNNNFLKIFNEIVDKKSLINYTDFKNISDNENVGGSKWCINKTENILTDYKKPEIDLNTEILKLVPFNRDYFIDEINVKRIYSIYKTNNYYQHTDEFILKLYDLFCHDYIDTNEQDFEYLRNVGIYYKGKEDYSNMLKYYLMAVEKGDTSAMNNLGIYYHEEKDLDNMMKYYLMGIEKGNIMAMRNLARYYKSKKDFDNMLKYYLLAIKIDDDEAMRELGDYYSDNEDYINMKEYYLMAIQKGNIDAINNLGKHYIDNKNFNEAEKYLKMSRDKNSTNGFYYSMILKFKKKNYELVKKYLSFDYWNLIKMFSKYLIVHHEADEIHQLGLYFREIGIYKPCMVPILMISANKGHDESMKILGDYYKANKDDENMKKYYLMAVEKGNSEAMFFMGYYYHDKEDYENMKKYFLMGVEKGHDKSMDMLGLFYKNIEDFENMKKYYLMAIDKGNTNAMWNLGDWYKDQEDDYNIKEDYVNAIKYLKMGAEKGNNNCMNCLGMLYEKLNDFFSMKQYYNQAIENKNKWAMFNLASWYEKREDNEKAIKYYRMAFENGHEGAKNKLRKYMQ